LDLPLAEAPELPFVLAAIPKAYPKPKDLRLWVVEVTEKIAPDNNIFVTSLLAHSSKVA